jgi:hypothetical protein
MTVNVNGKKVKTLSGCNSGGWSTVGTKKVDIKLEPGVNVIRLTNTSSWMPDLDYIDVVKKVPTAINAVRTEPSAVNSQLSTVNSYDLAGRQTRDGRGIVITNGKKYFKH